MVYKIQQRGVGSRHRSHRPNYTVCTVQSFVRSLVRWLVGWFEERLCDDARSARAPCMRERRTQRKPTFIQLFLPLQRFQPNSGLGLTPVLSSCVFVCMYGSSLHPSSAASPSTGTRLLVLCVRRGSKKSSSRSPVDLAHSLHSFIQPSILLHHTQDTPAQAKYVSTLEHFTWYLVTHSFGAPAPWWGVERGSRQRVTIRQTDLPPQQYFYPLTLLSPAGGGGRVREEGGHNTTPNKNTIKYEHEQKVPAT